MEIYLYTFNKRINSTGRPAGEGTVFSGKLREGCDTLSPVIGINLGHSTSPAGYNYAYIESFGRYYWIQNWRWEAGLWWCECKVDALATWRTEILASSQYVKRTSDTTAYNGDIIDTMYPSKSGPIVRTISIDSPWLTNPSPTDNGYYVLGIANQDPSAIGGTSYYAFTNAEFRSLVRLLLSSTDWTGFTDGDSDLTESVYKSLFNPLQYISTCVWFPMTPPLGASVAGISFGWWTINGVSCHRLRLPWQVYGATVSVPQHPQAAARGRYLNGAPYTQLSLVGGPFGKIILNSSLFSHQDRIEIRYYIDFVTGGANCVVSAGTSTTPGVEDTIVTDQTVGAQFGVPIQLTQLIQNFTGAGQAILDSMGSAIGNMVTGFMAGGPVAAVGGLIAGGGSGILSAADCLMPQVQSLGANGSFSSFAISPKIEAWHWLVVDEDLGNHGRPLCAVVGLSQLAGGSYALIAHPEVFITGTDAEQQEIYTFMASGFFLE